MNKLGMQRVDWYRVDAADANDICKKKPVKKKKDSCFLNHAHKLLDPLHPQLQLCAPNFQKNAYTYAM